MIGISIQSRSAFFLQYCFTIGQLGPSQGPMALAKGVWRSHYSISQNLKLCVDGLVFGHFDELENKK